MNHREWQRLAKGARIRKWRAALSLALLPALLGACAGSAVVGGIANVAREAVGARKPALPEAQQAPRIISLKLHAAEQLNVDAAGRPLALVTRLYALRQSAAFEQAPFDTFLSAQKEKNTFGSDLLEAREIILIPGQHYEAQEKLSKQAGFIGVVALFNTPAPQRWRLAFSAQDAERSGLVIGMHACAMTVGVGATNGAAALQTLGAIRCR